MKVKASVNQLYYCTKVIIDNQSILGFVSFHFASYFMYQQRGKFYIFLIVAIYRIIRVTLITKAIPFTWASLKSYQPHGLKGFLLIRRYLKTLQKPYKENGLKPFLVKSLKSHIGPFWRYVLKPWALWPLYVNNFEVPFLFLLDLNIHHFGAMLYFAEIS